MRLPWQKKPDEDLDDEIRSHFAMAVADRIARGDSPESAVAAARREFGNITHVKEVTREMWGGIWMERLLQDLRFAARSLRRSPGFAVVAVLTLALGIGINSAMFTVMNGVLLRPLPFPEPDRLFVVSYLQPPGPFTHQRGLFDRTFLQLAELEKKNPIFSHLTTFGTPNVTLRGVGEPVMLSAGAVTPDFFATFGARAEIGRFFTSDEPVVVLADRLWRSRFNADPNIVGKTIDVDNEKRTVVGVMPASFNMPAYMDMWIPLTLRPKPGNVQTRIVVARLRDGMTPEAALEAWKSIAPNLELYPDANRADYTPELIPLKKTIVGDAQRPLLIFAGAVAFVLLIACANVANLLLMRVTTRDREMAVRAALGAGRSRLVRQLLTETFVIASVGSVLGIGLAVAAAKALISIAPSEVMPRVENVHLDGWVLLFTIGLVLATTLFCGLVPALHASEERLRSSLSESARTLTGGHGRIRSALVISEVALALVLLVGAGLMIRSFDRMRKVDLGFSAANTFTARVALPEDRYRTAVEMHQFHERVLAGLSAIPGVASVGVINWLPFSHMLIAGDFQIEGSKPKGRWADKMVVSTDYFRTVGQRVIAGRGFTANDRAGAPNVVIISESVAKKLWPAGDAVGKRISMEDKPTEADWITIVGVVNDVIQSSVTDKPDPAIYQPIDQVDRKFFVSNVNYVVRTAASSDAIAPAMRRVLRDADPTLPLGTVVEMKDLVGMTMLTPRFQSRVLIVFAALALTLAVIGIYGVLAYGVTQRRHEIGVRVALGASPSAVRAMVVRRTAVLAVPGLLIGIGASYGLTGVLKKFLFQITPTDPLTFAVVAALLAAVALAAAYVPAKRASEVDPLVALRD